MPTSALGIAYAISACVDNLLGTLGPIAIGEIIDGSSSRSRGYYFVPLD